MLVTVNQRVQLGELVSYRKSEISGSGLFANYDIPKGSFIHRTHLYDHLRQDWTNLTPCNLYNHSKENKNCEVIADDKGMILMSIKDIKKGEELLADYGHAQQTQHGPVILEQPQENWK
jgi:hypothetical protein